MGGRVFRGLRCPRSVVSSVLRCTLLYLPCRSSVAGLALGAAVLPASTRDINQPLPVPTLITLPIRPPAPRTLPAQLFPSHPTSAV